MIILSAIPIDRNKTTKRTNIVSVMAEMLHLADALLLVIEPEGTRSNVKQDFIGYLKQQMFLLS